MEGHQQILQKQGETKALVLNKKVKMLLLNPASVIKSNKITLFGFLNSEFEFLKMSEVY